MNLRHGIQIQEQPTSLVSPVTSESAVQVIVGVAPVNLATDNENPLAPKLAYRYSEAVEKVGMCSDLENYPICQSIVASFEIYNVSPIILINVLDPTRHKTDATDVLTVVDSGIAVIEQQGILLDTLVVKSKDRDVIYQAGQDYTAMFNQQGLVEVLMKPDVLQVGEILVSYDMLDPSKVTVDDILSGIRKIREVFPRFGIIPGTLIVPGWSHLPEVYQAMIAQADNLNGCFRYMAICDLDMLEATTYDKCKEIKDRNGMTNPHCMVTWAKVRSGNRILYQSVLLAAHIAYNDYLNNNVPYISPSNKEYRISGLCGATGEEIILDVEQANQLNSIGIVTAINFDGWKCWGNRTAVFPSSSDVKDVFIPVRRMFNWWCNTFIQTYFAKVDDPTNRKLIESIVDSERIRANAYKSQYKIADAGIEFRLEENPETDLLAGVLRLRMWLSPYPPAESIISTIEYDVSALKKALA